MDLPKLTSTLEEARAAEDSMSGYRERYTTHAIHHHPLVSFFVIIFIFIFIFIFTFIISNN